MYGAVSQILIRELAEPKDESQVAELLSVSKSQAKVWLTKLVAEGVSEKLANPIRYRAVTPGNRLL